VEPLSGPQQEFHKHQMADAQQHHAIFLIRFPRVLADVGSGPPRLLLLVVDGIVGRIVVGKNRVGLVVVAKFGYIAFVVEVAIDEMKLVDRD
nr:hypothetical protein [Tanacetum cinerariifolium]